MLAFCPESLSVCHERPLYGTVKQGRQPTLGKAVHISLGKTSKYGGEEAFHFPDPWIPGAAEGHALFQQSLLGSSMR